jgi:hypothetical protein
VLTGSGAGQSSGGLLWRVGKLSVNDHDGPRSDTAP